MPTALLDDELWKLIEPLVPARKRRFRNPGRKRLDNCRTPAGILLTAAGARLRLGHDLLAALRGVGTAGVFQALHERLLAQRRSDGRLDLSRAVCDSA